MFADDRQIVSHELPFTIENQHHIGQPYVSPLLWAIDEYEEYLIVMVDNESAQFHKAYLGNLETESTMTLDLDFDWGEKTLMPASDGDGTALRQGTNRDAFDDMISAHIDRFYGDIANTVRDYIPQDNPVRLILAGDERSAHALHDKLHESVTRHFVAIVPIPMNGNADEVMKRITKPAYNYERNYEYDLVEQIISSAHAGGSAVLGRDSLNTAMTMQQVQEIIMPYDLLTEDQEFAHSLTMWALENNSSIKFVHGQAARKLKSNGGIGAKLYYAIETVQ